MSIKHIKIGIIGGTGWMGKIMGEALLEKEIVQPQQLWITNREKPNSYSKPIHFTTHNQALVDQVDVIILAVRPQQFFELDINASGKLIISVMAKISMQEIAKHSEASRIIRAMPNAAVVEHLSYTPWCGNANVTANDKEIAAKIFNCFGLQDEFSDDDKINFMTALTGSSHGFFSYVAKNLIDSAVNYGLERNLAERAIRQALKGMGKLIGDEESSPHETIDFLTSYGGTTITEAALASLERDKLNEVISRAIEAGYRKATEVV